MTRALKTDSPSLDSFSVFSNVKRQVRNNRIRRCDLEKSELVSAANILTQPDSWSLIKRKRHLPHAQKLAKMASKLSKTEKLEQKEWLFTKGHYGYTNACLTGL